MKKIIFIAVVLMLCSTSVFAASRNLIVSWTCNTETDLAGYTLWSYVGTSTIPSTTTDIPYVASMICTKTVPITVPDNALTSVCVDMDAYDTSGNHSPHSTKPCKSIDAQAPGAPKDIIITITSGQ